MNADTLLRIEDHFCGAGGNTTGAKGVEGVEVVHAANHSHVAIATHSTNYPEVEHTLGDIPTLDPRRHSPPADVLITSPECREHSYAKGRAKDDPSLFDPVGDQTAERSRSTMDEVPRWAEIKRYQAVIVENVPQIVHWCEPRRSGHRRKCRCGVTFRGWLRDMTNLGYQHRKVYLNSGFFPPVPQSRDRVYIVFWRRGQRTPALDYFPPCWCESCGRVVPGVQTPKAHLQKPDAVRLAWGPHDTVWGRYGEQYYYACAECAKRANPAITPAAYAIEWWREAVPIGEREQHGMPPLRSGTIARIKRGLARLPERPLVVPLDYLTQPASRRARDVVDPLATITGQHRSALVVQVAGNLGRLHKDGTIERDSAMKAWPVSEQLRTISTTIDRALVAQHPVGDLIEGKDHDEIVRAEIVPEPGPVTTARSPDELLNTLEATQAAEVVEFGSPLVVPYRANTRIARGDQDQLHTITAVGNQHYVLNHPDGQLRLITANYGSPDGPASKQGWLRCADERTLGSITTADSHAVVTLRGEGQVRHAAGEPMPTCATVEQHTLVGVPQPVAVEQCSFRMFEPSEVGRGMVMHLNAHGKPYIVHGTRRQQVNQYGNAVTPPVMTWLVTQLRNALA
jgi:DNA (cytosine-5)-methyltransferase 1